MRDHGRIQPGQNVLINGASGGVGTFAVQIAKSFGAGVTAVWGLASIGRSQKVTNFVAKIEKEDLAFMSELAGHTTHARGKVVITM